MADNNRISIKKTSRVLAITCVAYTTVTTILYDNYRIDLIAYSLGHIRNRNCNHVMRCTTSACSVHYSPRTIFLLAARSYHQ